MILNTNNRLRCIARTLVAALAVAFFAPLPAALVHAQTLSPQQLEQLRNLTPEQRQRIVEALGDASPATAPPKRPDSEAPADGRAEPATAEQEPVGPPKVVPGDMVVIEITHPDPNAVRHLGLREAIGSRLYEVAADGSIDFPKVGRIVLAGLTEEGVVLRLRSEPSLIEYGLSASILTLTPTGSKALKPFGYELFNDAPTTFAPTTDVPVPVDYVVGVGDTINVQTFGTESASMSFVVGRDGQVVFPKIGPVSVVGLSFGQLREELQTRIEEKSIGVQALVTMGELRSIRVFVLGDVNRPGSYTVSSLSTMTNALFVSGGLLESGSMRDVQLKRNNKVVGRLDLYDLLLKGNTRADVRLKPGDVIFVPPVRTRVSIYGQVRRPASYELKGAANLDDLLQLAGGLLPSAYRGEARVMRFNDRGRQDVLSVDLNRAQALALRGGDVVQVLTALTDVDNAVTLSGHVLRTGVRQWFSGMRLTDLIGSAAELDERADPNYVLIHRRIGGNRLSKLVSANLALALQAPGGDEDVELKPLDEVIVFSLDADRAERIKPLLEGVREQSNTGELTAVITIVGRVRAPGSYPLESGMTISDLLRAAGGLLESAYVEEAELTRQIADTELGEGARTSQHFSVDLAAAMRGSADEDIVLQPYDFVTVREIPQWRDHETVELSGEVRFPGIYAIRRGEFLSSVIDRAGGLTDMAFTEGSVFLREELQEREKEQLDRLANRVRREINALPVDRVESRESAEQLLLQLESTKPQGRLVIDLDALLANVGNESMDILVKDGDTLVIPPRSQEVTVIGEVQYATSHIYTPSLDRQGYILKSGDVTANADVKRIYVVRANGNVVARSKSAWFGGSRGDGEIRPGDTIVVPLDADRISNLSLWTSVTQIIYNIGIATAAVASF